MQLQSPVRAVPNQRLPDRRIATGEVSLQRPGGVGVADHKGEVGYVGEHHAAINVVFSEIDGFSVDAVLYAAGKFQVEAGGQDNNVCRAAIIWLTLVADKRIYQNWRPGRAVSPARKSAPLCRARHSLPVALPGSTAHRCGRR